MSKCLLIAMLGLLGAADKAQTDKEKLQGLWQVVSQEVDGMLGPEAIAGQMKYTFKKDTLTVHPAEPSSDSEFTCKLEPGKKVNTIDMKVAQGANTGLTYLGIYQVDGDDLKICFGVKPGNERPKNFATRDGSGTVLIILKRARAGP